MIKETITYTDYDGVERTEEFRFNLTKAEITEMHLSTVGGMDKLIQGVVAAKDVPQLASLFKKIICAAYGVKSADGRRFIKNEEVLNEFLETEAYSKLYMKLVTDDQYAAKFINGIIPPREDKANENVPAPMVMN